MDATGGPAVRRKRKVSAARDALNGPEQGSGVVGRMPRSAVRPDLQADRRSIGGRDLGRGDPSTRVRLPASPRAA
jgi:hypothetical protein